MSDIVFVRCCTAPASGQAANNSRKRLDDDGCGGGVSGFELSVQNEDCEDRGEDVQTWRDDDGASATKEFTVI